MKNLKKILILGGGEAAQLLIYHLHYFRSEKVEIVGILDDGLTNDEQLSGFPVLGRLEELKEVVQAEHVDKIIIAIPSLTDERKKEILLLCSEIDVETNILPDINSILSSGANPIQERAVSYSDLLNREEMKMNLENLTNFFRERTILITGAGGSIGSEIARQVNKCKPKKIILLGHGENSIYSVYKELAKVANCPIIPVIGDIRDKERLREVFDEYLPEIVYHAAAHKHVPLMETNPTEAIKNNIFGTMNVVDVSEEMDVEKFIMISTDKTVYPTSVMGTTKKIAEWIVQNKNTADQKTIFSVVRFGNVLGSRGSAIPLFWDQIRNNETITVTHPEMERYFMTIPEASQLVIEASERAEGNDIYILQMGQPQKIIDIVKKLIHLAGKKDVDIRISYTGLRNGEKLSESLFEKQEMKEMLQIEDKFYKGCATVPQDLSKSLQRINDALNDSIDNVEIQNILKTIIEETTREEAQNVRYS
jgi:FlaA1/EpsC-like NDP-sugar epimerase